MSASRHLGIVDAKRWPIDEAVSPMPQMGSTLMGWFRKLSLARVIQQMKDFKTQERILPVETSGVVMPLGAQEIALKPEGARTWDWQWIFATPDLVLQTDEVIVWKGTRYRIERALRFEDQGYVAYEAVNDYH